MKKNDKKVRITIMIPENLLIRLRKEQARLITETNSNYSMSTVISKSIRVPKVKEK